jgi:hypothetical protein
MGDRKTILPPLTFLDALQLLFIAFKLAGIIDWSWWWVLSPVIIYVVAHLLT